MPRPDHSTRRRLITLTAAVAGWLLAVAVVGAAEPKDQPAPQEKRVLGSLVGTRGPSTNNFQAMRAQWAVGGTYVQIDKHFQDEGKVDTMTLLTCDMQKRAYHCWQFSSLDDGSPQQGEGTWDDKSNTLTFACAPNAGGNALMITYTVSHDGLTYKEGVKDRAGKIQWDLTCEWVRRTGEGDGH